MSVRIYLEIGHEASIRTKKTQEGFTHDWEVYVKGCNDAEIHYYVEKVVFYLHETFPKPKRVIKEPPYLVKESGYAGFNLPIDIYLRNNHDPKKLRFNYDLRLQPSGPTLHSSQKEKYTFTSPSDDFRDKLLKGGGKLGSTLNVQETSDNRTLQDERGQMVNKPKLSGLDNNFKKHKVKLDDPKSTNSSFLALFGIPITTSQMTREKTSISKSVNKHSPQKDNQKDKEKSKIDLLLDKKSKDEKKFKDKSKEHEKSKDKNSKKDRSPLLKVSSPKRSSPRRSPPRSSPILHTHKHKESKYDKDKRDRNDERKSRKEKRDHKENKQKDNHEETFNKNMDYKDSKNRIDIKNFIKQKDITCVSPPPARLCNDIKDKTKFLTKDDKIVLHDEKKPTKYKKKDKKERKEEKVHKSSKKFEKFKENDKSLKENDKTNLYENQQIDNNSKKEKINLTNKINDDDSNSSHISPNDVILVETPMEQDISLKNDNIEIKKTKDDLDKTNKIREKIKKDKKNDKDCEKKRKRKTDLINENDEPQEKHNKREETVISNVTIEEEIKSKNEVEEYMEILRGLQLKIMGIKNNADLQKVVQLIADTGRFEISAHTFDFDLCLLDRSTVKQLQSFFTSES